MRMSPALNRSSVLKRFERGNKVELCNGIMFDFYLGLPHIVFEMIELQNSCHKEETPVCISICAM